MNFEQAEQIRKYNGVPSTRAEQISLIQTAGYSTLHRVPLSECFDAKVFSAAKRLYEQAVQLTSSVRNNPLIAGDVSRNYARTLTATFNLPLNGVDTELLEARLLE